MRDLHALRWGVRPRKNKSLGQGKEAVGALGDKELVGAVGYKEANEPSRAHASVPAQADDKSGFTIFFKRYPRCLRAEYFFSRRRNRTRADNGFFGTLFSPSEAIRA
jgi:hypothetical protein